MISVLARVLTRTHRRISAPLSILDALSDTLAHQHEPTAACVHSHRAKRCVLYIHKPIGYVVKTTTVNSCSRNSIYFYTYWELTRAVIIIKLDSELVSLTSANRFHSRPHPSIHTRPNLVSLQNSPLKALVARCRPNGGPRQHNVSIPRWLESTAIRGWRRGVKSVIINYLDLYLSTTIDLFPLSMAKI